MILASYVEEGNFSMDNNRRSQGAGRKGRGRIAVLVVEPGKEPYTKTIGRGLKPLQNEVAGHIEVIYPFDDPVAIILNNNGKYQGLARNRGLYDGKGELCDVIAGTFLVVGVKGEDFVSLSEALAAKYMEKYKIPEQATCINEEDKGIPVPYDKKSICPEERLKSRENNDKKLVHLEDGVKNGLCNEECGSKKENPGRCRKKRRIYGER